MDRNKLKEEVLAKTHGVCAYCGKNLTTATMQIDHVQPIYRGWDDDRLAKAGLTRGKDDISNYLPSCRSCNHRKGTLTLEEFRKELADQAFRLIYRNAQVRQSIEFGLLKNPGIHPVIFYFERAEAKKYRKLDTTLLSDIKPGGIVSVYFNGADRITHYIVKEREKTHITRDWKTKFVTYDNQYPISIEQIIPYRYTAESVYVPTYDAYICTNDNVAKSHMVEYWYRVRDWYWGEEE